MRTLEMPDEVFEQAEAEAKQRGITVQDLVIESVRQTLQDSSFPKRTILEFPLIRSGRPGTLKITNEDIRRMEEEDDLRMLGMLD